MTQERTPEEEVEHCRRKMSIAAENMIASQGLVIRKQDDIIKAYKEKGKHIFFTNVLAFILGVFGGIGVFLIGHAVGWFA